MENVFGFIVFLVVVGAFAYFIYKKKGGNITQDIAEARANVEARLNEIKDKFDGEDEPKTPKPPKADKPPKVK